MKTKNLILYVLMVFACFGCESFLEEDPKALISPETFFASENDARQAVQGMYAILKNNSLYGQVGLDHFYDNGADILEPNREAGMFRPIGNYSMDESLADESAQKMGVTDTWKDLYKIIYNVNIILDAVDGNEALTEAIQLDVMSDARFVRALAYWHITNLWGDAPFYTERLKIDEVALLGRTPKAKILEQVVEDLEFAQEHLPRRDAIPAKDRGRASKWAASIVLAKIHMQEHEWQKGLDVCNDIIDHSSHALLDNYADVFSHQNEYNDEIIWSLDFAKDLVGQLEVGVPQLPGNGNWRPSMFSPRLRDEPKNTSERTALSDSLKSLGLAFNGTGLQVACKSFAEEFPVNDLRRPMNVMDKFLGFDLVFPYMPKMWNLNVDESPRFNHEDNRIIFRLADVYLMAAECENELNGPANAYAYINEVRKRAFATQVEWELKGMDKQQFREAIYDERKWELAAECNRRYDLIRWGILLDVVQNDVEYRFWTPGANIKAQHVLLPIPLQQITLNPNLLTSDPTNNGYR